MKWSYRSYSYSIGALHPILLVNSGVGSLTSLSVKNGSCKKQSNCPKTPLSELRDGVEHSLCNRIRGSFNGVTLLIQSGILLNDLTRKLLLRSLFC